MNHLENQSGQSVIVNILALPQFQSLKNPDFKYTWLAGMSSGAAMWTFVIATSWIVFNDSSSSTWVGITTFSAMIPFLIISPIAGLLGDYFDRKKIVIVMFIVSALMTGFLTILTFRDWVEFWQIAIFAFVNGTVRSMQEPSVTSLIPNQVPKDHLLNALVLNSATRHGARFFGLIIAAPLIVLKSTGIVAVLALSTIFQICGVLLMSQVKTESTGHVKPEDTLFNNLIAGLSYIYSNYALGLFIFLVAFHCALVMSFESIMPVFSIKNLGADNGSVFNYLMMGFGAGSLLGMITLAGVKTDSVKGRFLLITALGSGIAPILLAISENVNIAIFFSLLMGVFQATFMALTNTFVQTLAPDRLRARISSLYIFHAGGIMAFANLGYGFIADIITAPPTIIVPALIYLVLIIAIISGQPIMKNIFNTGRVSIG